MTGFRQWVSLTFCCACLCVLGRGEDAADVFEANFHRVAAMEGAPRATATRALERQDPDILRAAVPFLEMVVEEEDAAARDLAQNLLLKIRQPDKHEAWVKAASVTSRRNVRINEEGAMTVSWSEGSEARAKHLGLWPLPEEVLITPEAGPVIRSRLREGQRSGVLPLIPGCLDAAWAPALINAIGFKSEDPMVPLLAQIAADAEDVLISALTAVQESSIIDPEDNRAARQRHHTEIRAAAVAEAIAMAKGEDFPSEKTAQAVSLAIDKISNSDALIRLVAAAVDMDLAETGEHLFHRAYATASDEGISRGAALYCDLRRHALRWMRANGADWLIESNDDLDILKSSMRAGWLFDYQHPGIAEEMYLYWSDSYSDLLQHWDRVGEPLENGHRLFWRGNWTSSGFTIPTPLLTERAAVRPPHSRPLDFSTPATGGSQLAELARREDAPLAFEVIARWFPQTSAIYALGELGDPRAFDLFVSQPDLFAQRSETFLPMASAAMRLGGAGAVEYLEGIVALGEMKPGETRENAPPNSLRRASGYAKQLLPAARGDDSALVAILEGEDAFLQPLAARLLALRSHPLGVDKLIDLAIQSRGMAHESHRNFLVNQKDVAAELLEKRLRESDDWQERLFAESVLLRIGRPETVENFERAIRTGQRPSPTKALPTLDQRLSTAAVLLKSAGEESLKLFEAAAAFQSDTRFALLALAAEGSDQSLDFLIQILPEIPPQSRAEMVFVLSQFGDRGIEAAKSVPAADPARDGFGARRRAHLAATETLASADDEVTLEKVLEGLATLPPPDFTGRGDDERREWRQWNNRSIAYLHQARKFRDPRLLEIAIDLIERRHLLPVAVQLAGDYEDPRILSLCWEILNETRRENKPTVLDQVALDVIIAGLGDQVVSEVAERFESEESSDLRRKWIGIIARLGDISADRNRSDLSREAVLGIRSNLIQALDDPDDGLGWLAAETLARLSSHTSGSLNIDRAATDALIAWSRKQRRVPSAVVSYLSHDGHPDVPEIMMRLYLDSPRRESRIASTLARLGHTAALPEIVKTAEGKMLTGRCSLGVPELDVIRQFGAEGRRHLRELAGNQEFDFSMRVRAVSILVGQSRADGREVVLGLVDEYLEADGQVAPFHGQHHLGNAVRIALGAEAAHELFVRKLLATDNETQQTWLSHWLMRWERENPELSSHR